MRRIGNRVKDQDARIARQAQQDPIAQRLLTLRGIGPLTATALAGALGDGSSFTKDREFATSLGQTPRQHSTVGKERLSGISKHSDPCLRKFPVYGARSVIRHAKYREDGLSH